MYYFKLNTPQFALKLSNYIAKEKKGVFTMKKITVLLVSIIFMLSMVVTSYASSVNSGDPASNENKNTAVKSKIRTMEELRVQLKLNHKDKAKRKEILKEMVELRKRNGDNSTPVVANGTDVKFDVPPVIKSGRLLIPVRAVTNALGADVNWDPSTPNIVKIVKKVSGASTGTDQAGQTPAEVTIVIIIDLKTGKVTVNDKEVVLDVPAQLISNRTMVPIRFIAETFGMKVEYDKESGGVFIDDEDDATAPAEPSATDTTTAPSTTDTTTTTAPSTTTESTPSTTPAQ